MPTPTISPGPTSSALKGVMGSSMIIGSPRRSVGVAPAITYNQRGVITLYPTVVFAGLTRKTLDMQDPQFEVYRQKHLNSEALYPLLSRSSTKLGIEQRGNSVLLKWRIGSGAVARP